MSNSVDLRDYPNADFYFKLVAKVNGQYFSIFDSKTEYKIGVHLHEPAKPNREGGYYVFIAPRTILKVIAWGDCVQYPKGKIAFSNVLPVEDLGLPIGYKNTKGPLKMALKE